MKTNKSACCWQCQDGHGCSRVLLWGRDRDWNNEILVSSLSFFFVTQQSLKDFSVSSDSKKLPSPQHQVSLVPATPLLLPGLPAKTSTSFLWLPQGLPVGKLPCSLVASRVIGTCHLSGYLDWKVPKTIEGALGSRKKKDCRFKQPGFFLLFSSELGTGERAAATEGECICLSKSTNRTRGFPSGWTSMTTFKTFPISGFCSVKPGRSREQRSERGQMGNENSGVPGVAPKGTSSDPTDLAVDVSCLKPPRDGFDIPPSSRVRVCCWQWQPRFPCGLEHSLCCKELRAGASQRWLLICMAWGGADTNSSSSQGRESSVVQFPQSIQIYSLMVLRLRVLCKIIQIPNT